MTIDYILQRVSDNRESTIGILMRERKPLLPHLISYTLEDEMRESKVSKETRVPAGRYPIVVNKSETPLTLKYRSRFPTWFRFHLMLNKVPGFIGVYIHLGNDDDDTDGCILVGDSVNNNTLAHGEIRSSTQAYMRVYSEITGYLEDPANSVFLTIRDEKFLML